MRKGEKRRDHHALLEYWTLARRDGAWMVASIEQRAEGDHHLDEEIVASPWSDAERLGDEALTELAVADALPPRASPPPTSPRSSSRATPGRARSTCRVADARFAPDVLEAAARRAVGAWAEAVDGDDAALERGRLAGGGRRRCSTAATPRARPGSWCAGRA